MDKKVLFFILLFFNVCAYAQSDAHITGHVLDAQTNEHLPFVNVQIEGTSIGCLTDESGHFYLRNLPEGKLVVVFSMMGYETIKKDIVLRKDTLVEMNISIQETSFIVDNVVVTANKYKTKKKRPTKYKIKQQKTMVKKSKKKKKTKSDATYS